MSFLSVIPKPRSLRSRFLRSSIALLILIVIGSVLAASLFTAKYYYGGMRTSMMAKATSSSDLFSSYVSRTYSEYYQNAYSYTESFEDRDRLELQFLDSKGLVEISSFGITTGSYPDTEDITAALSTGEISSWDGRLESTGERIMAVSAPLQTADGTVIGVMRYVSSLRLVDRQVYALIGLLMLLGGAIIAIVLLASILFIRTITEPIQGLISVARRITGGSYGIQARKQYDDEIGMLTDAINEMSVKISQTDRMQSEFISSVSHELRTPLTAIAGWSETLAYDENIQGDSRRGVEIISKEAARLTKMVEELLEFTRIQDGRFTLNVETVDLSAEVEDAIYTYGKLLRRDNIVLRYCPPEQDIPTILGDPERLKQVFLNILDNAAKYGRDGRYIDVSLGLAQDFATIRIRDYGPGIPEDELPYVKNKFYKGSSKERGSGIGLAICDEIIQRHKGQLTLCNAEGGGTLVIIHLPIQKPEGKNEAGAPLLYAESKDPKKTEKQKPEA